MAPGIIINSKERQMKIAARVAADTDAIPIRILCPDMNCRQIYTLFIKDFDQGLNVLLGQACPYCRRFLTEKDDPDKVLMDAKEIREALQGGKNNG